jgi:hypothetical protein
MPREGRGMVACRARVRGGVVACRARGGVGACRSVTFTDLSKGVMSATDWRKSDGSTVARSFPPLR